MYKGRHLALLEEDEEEVALVQRLEPFATMFDLPLCPMDIGRRLVESTRHRP